MVPDVTRRQYLSGLSIATLTAVTGCIDAVADENTDTPAGDTDAPTGDVGSEPGTSTGPGTSTERPAPTDTDAETPTDTATPTEHPTGTDTPTDTQTDPHPPSDTPTPEKPATDDPTTSAPTLDARVVEAVTFDTAEDRARVHFVDSPVADSVTVEAENAISARSTDTPTVIEYLDVYPDPAGDELVVRATVDGESRVVHRERYPPSERAVEDVTYDDDPDGFYEATARVDFTGTQEGDELTVRSTVAGHETTLSPAGSVTYSVVGLDPDGDEVVVSLTADGTTEEIHRERYYP